MVDKNPSELAAGDEADAGTAIFHGYDGGNSRGFTGLDIARSKNWTPIEQWSWTGNQTTIDFNDLDEWDELIVYLRLVTTGSSTSRLVTLSSDNGSSFYTTSGDYASVAASGAETNATSMNAISTSSALARTGGFWIPNWNKALIKPALSLIGNLSYVINQAAAMNALRISNGAGANFTGGDVYLFGR